jgi:hypothetical protein
MTSELIPAGPAPKPPKVKDILIAVLALSLCLCLAALLHESGQRRESSKRYAEQVEKMKSQQQTAARSLAAAEQGKAQSDRALRRAQLALKAGYEAQGIALRLRQGER